MHIGLAGLGVRCGMNEFDFGYVKKGMKAVLGFTMLEMMVTLVIVGVVAALAAPSISDMLERNLIRSEAQRVSGLFNLARTFAITNNRAVIVYGNLSGSALNLDVYSDSDEDNTLTFEPADEYIKRLSGNAGNLKFGINAAGSDQAIRFDRRGRLNESAAALVTICDEELTQGLQIAINLVGRVSVSQIETPNSTNCI